ncbi:hypothetical protein FRC02_004121 [Tulasnella sp. 418]|nr:hypothetical protein FRC02_004121 [Tulasnella sp. 418]
MVTTRGKRVTYKESAPSSRKRSKRSTQAELKTEQPAKKRKNEKRHASSSSTNNSASTGKVSKRLQGRLAGLMNMPIDIFAEICCYLYPLDLLHLVWSSKAIRSVLMSKTSKPIWRTARKNQVPDLPECPSILTEPQYATLVFTTICQGCGCLRASRNFIGFYARYCSECVDDYVMKLNPTEVSLSANRNLLRSVGWDVLVYLIPTSLAREVGDPSGEKWKWTTRELMDNLAVEWSKPRTAEAKLTFLASRMDMVGEIMTHVTDLLEWQNNQRARQIKEEKDIRKARYDSIKERLGKLGWEDSDLPTHRWGVSQRKWYQLVERKQMLTDKVWKNLYPKLVPLLEEFRIENMNEERDRRVTSRALIISPNYSQLRESLFKEHDDIFFPVFLCGFRSKHTISHVPLINELLEDDKPLTRERWDKIVPGVLDFLTMRTANLEKKLIAWYRSELKQSYDCPSTSPELQAIVAKQLSAGENLNLRDPTVVFKCDWCSEPLWYPACFLHAHFAEYPTLVDCEAWAFEKISNTCLSFCPEYIFTVSQLLTCLGVDASSTTSMDLPYPLPNPYSTDHHLTEDFLCGMCNRHCAEPMTMPKLLHHICDENAGYEQLQEMIVKDGRAAFTRLGKKRDLPANLNDHCISSNRIADTLWRQLSEDELEQLEIDKIEHETQLDQYRSQDYCSITQKYWSNHDDCFTCTLCPKLRRFISGIFSEMIYHVKAKHGVDVLCELEARSLELAETDGDGDAH